MQNIKSKNSRNRVTFYPKDQIDVEISQFIADFYKKTGVKLRETEAINLLLKEGINHKDEIFSMPIE